MTDRTPLEQDLAALLLRCMVGGLMLFHGVSKLDKGIEWLPKLLAKHGLPTALAPGIYLGEVVAPVLLILGIATRSSAAAIVFTMFMAVWLLHTDELFALGKHGEYALEIHVFFAVGAICAALLGPGRFAVPLPERFRHL